MPDVAERLRKVEERLGKVERRLGCVETGLQKVRVVGHRVADDHEQRLVELEKPATAPEERK